MPNRKKVERSANYSYYSDLLWCTVPLIGMSWYYYGARPVLLLLAALLTAYLCDCALAPLHGTGYQSHEPSSECFAALIALLMPASISYPIVISAVIVAVLVKEAFGGEGHYPFHPAAVGVVVAGISWPQDVFSYPIPGTQLPLFGSVNTTLVEGMNATLRDGGLPSASTMNLLTGNVSAAMGTSAALVVMACGLFLLVRGHIKLSVVIPFFIFVIGLPWFFPNLNELPTFSLPWEYIRQRFYLEKYVVLSGTALFTGLFLICEPVTMPDRRMSRIIYGAALGLYNSRLIRLINKKGKLKSSLIIDELPTIYVRGLDNLIATARSNKVSVCLGFQDFSQLERDYGEKEAKVIINTVGNVFSGQVVGDTARTLSDRFGKIVQLRESHSVSNENVTTSTNTQLETLIPASKISNLTQGMFVGSVADNFDERIGQKIFHAEIVIDNERVRAETATYVSIPEISSFVGEDGKDHMEEIVRENYYRVKADIAELVLREIARIEADPKLSQLLPKKKQG